MTKPKWYQDGGSSPVIGWAWAITFVGCLAYWFYKADLPWFVMYWRHPFIW